MSPKLIPLDLLRSDARPLGFAYWGAPLSLQLKSKEGFTEIQELRVELHSQRLEPGKEAICVESLTEVGSAPVITFPAAKMAQIGLDGRKARTVYVAVRIIRADDGDPDLLDLGQLEILSNPSSATIPPDPAPGIEWASSAALAAKKTRFEAVSIAALRALSVSAAVSGETANVTGYYAARDGGGGEFIWDAASVEADDTGMVIAPNSGGTGRWKRVSRPDRIKAAWYGARPAVSTDQTALIQKAIDKVSANGGGVVELDAGTFRIGDPVNPLRSKDNVTIEGKGRRATILQQAPGLVNCPVIEFGDPASITTGVIQRNIGVRNLGIDLWNNRSGKGIRVRFPCVNMRVENCDCWLSRVEAGDPYHAAGDDHLLDMSVRLPGVSQLWIEGCRVTHCVQLTSNGLAGVDGLYILNNWIEDPVAYGLAITGILQQPGFSIKNVFIIGNTFKNCGSGINVGRDQTNKDIVGGVIDFYPVEHVFQNLVIEDNHFIVGGVHSATFSYAISISTYQTKCSGIRIANNTISLAEGTTPAGQVGIKLTVYDYNWFPWKMASVAPLIASVDTSTGTATTGIITANKAHYLQDGMAVYFERTTTADVLPAPLVEYRRYRAVRVDDTKFKLTDFRTGRAVEFKSAQTGNIKFMFSPCVQDAEITGNIISGMTEGIRLDAGAGIGIRHNRLTGGSIYLFSGHPTEDIDIESNTLHHGFITALGAVVNGKLTGNTLNINDGFFTSGNGAAVNLAPSTAVQSQDWYLERNKVDVIRLDGQPIFRVAAGCAASRGLGRVTLWNVDGNICTDAVPKPFDELMGDNVMIDAWGKNKVRRAAKAFKPNSPALRARFLASTLADTSLGEMQSAAEASAKALLTNALLFEGVTANAQAVATLTAVSFGAEGRAVSWRHCVSTRITPAGLWALSSSATAGHAAHALYAFEKDGILTIRQMGAAAGTLIINAQDGAIGDVTGGDYRQVVIDVIHRRGLPTHFLVSIDRTGTLVVYVEGLPVVVAETVSGTAPAWNNALMPASPSLNIGFFDTTFPTFEGAFYGFDVLNFAPTGTQAQSLFAGGMAALPEYGLVHPAEMVVNGGFADGSNWNTGAPEAGATISGGTANFINAAAGVGIQQSGTGANYRKGRYYRLKFNLVTYGAGLMYVAVGDGLANLRTPFAPVEGTNVFEGKAGSSGGITTFRANGGTTLSIDNLSIIPLGAVASYVFDSGLGYQIEDKAGLKNHLMLAASGVTHLSPALTARFTGKITSASGAGDFIVRNGFMLEPGHVITRIQAYSTSGGTITVGEGPGGQSASLVASINLTAGVLTDLTLLKKATASLRMYAALGTATSVQLRVQYEVPLLLS